MDWQPSPIEGLFVAESFAFSGGGRMDVRLAYRTLGTLAPDRENAVLLLHGTTGSGRQFLQPAFAGAMFGPGGPLDARSHYAILPDAIGHGGSSKPSDGLERSFPCYGYADMVAAQHRLVTEGLGLQRLRLVMGTSMGGMQTWMWGGRHPDMMDTLMPIASLPERVTGRNLLWRRLLLQLALLDEPQRHEAPPRGLGLAWVLFQMMAASPARLAEQLGSPAQADAYIRSVADEALAREHLFDVIREFEASRDYDPAEDLRRIQAPLLAVNFADDAVNPAELGVMDRMITQVKDGRAVLLPASDASKGHQTLSEPALWIEHLRDLLHRSRPLPMKSVTLNDARNVVSQYRSRTVPDNDEALLSDITAFEDHRYDAMVRGDAAVLAAVFDEGLIYTHSSGVRQDAAEYLRGLEAGTDVYRKIEHGIDRTVRLADSVLVYGCQRMTVESGGATRELDNLSLAVLSRPGGRWMLAAYVSTPRGHAAKPKASRS